MQRSLVLMHKRQDEVGVQMHQFSSELKETQKRVEILEEVGAEHCTANRASIVRMDAVERELQALRNQVNREREAGRAPAGTCCAWQIAGASVQKPKRC